MIGELLVGVMHCLGPFAWPLLALGLATLPAGPLLARVAARGRLVSPAAWLALPCAVLGAGLLGSWQGAVLLIDFAGWCGCSAESPVTLHDSGASVTTLGLVAGGGCAAGAALWQGSWAAGVHGRERLPPPCVAALRLTLLGCATLAGVGLSLAWGGWAASWLYHLGAAGVQRPVAPLLLALNQASVALLASLGLGALGLALARRATDELSQVLTRPLLIGAGLVAAGLGLCGAAAAYELGRMHELTHWGAWGRIVDEGIQPPLLPPGAEDDGRVYGDDETCVLREQGWVCGGGVRALRGEPVRWGVYLADRALPAAELPDGDIKLLVCAQPCTPPRGFWERRFLPALLGCDVVYLGGGEREPRLESLPGETVEALVSRTLRERERAWRSAP